MKEHEHQGTLFDASQEEEGYELDSLALLPDDDDRHHRHPPGGGRAATKVPIERLFMPPHIHRALNAYSKRSKKGAAGSREEQGKYGYDDHDDDTDSDDGSEDTLLEKLAEIPPQEDEEKALFLRYASKGRDKRHHRRAKNGSLDQSDMDDEDVEGQSPEHGAADRNTLRGRLAVPIVILLTIVLLAVFFAGGNGRIAKAGSSEYFGSKKKLVLEDVLSGKLLPEQRSINWLADAGDGVYSWRTSDSSIMLEDLAHNTSRILVRGSQILDPEEGIQLEYQTFSVSSDLRYILFGADRDQKWRHSSRSNFFIHDLTTSQTTALIKPVYPSLTAFAKWAPRGHSIAFVHDNDLYVTRSTNSTSPIRVTKDGNATIFNGIPDWVYEEEVFGTDSALWWSPDGRKLAFLRFDESEVEVYSYPIYNPNRQAPGASAYPNTIDMRYPKPGTPNPKVSVYAFDLELYERGDVDGALYELTTRAPLDVHDRVITEVAWVSDHDLILKETNRAGSRERVAHFDFTKSNTEGRQAAPAIITRDVDYEHLDGGWVETGQTVHGIDAFGAPRKDNSEIPSGYLDVLPDDKGFLHIALFSPPDTPTPVFLTSGDWEVDGGIRAVDVERKLIYFIAANPAVERHLYSVPLPTRTELEAYRSASRPVPKATPLTDTKKPGFYDVSFSPQAGFYLLNQRNGLPWQRVYKVGDSKFDFPLTDNAKLKTTLSEYSIPRTTFKTIEVNGVSLNVGETLPPGMDSSGRSKYPVLFRPYGGPSSQTVQNRYRVDYTHYLASSMGFVVVEVDGRGTGYKGRKFRSAIRKNLGEVEAADQVGVAEHYASLPFVDERRIGIQGWSYGGYLAAKVIETNSTAFSLGISVAPVTDWRYYDTIYTERYMGTLDENRAGYQKSAVTSMEGFKHANFMLLHGSGDDNVHFLNSAALLDRLTMAKVRDFRFRMFTDSAHSMGVRGAYTALHQMMTDFLVEKFGIESRRR